MKTIAAAALGELLPYDKLIAKLAETFGNPPSVPPRHHYDMDPKRPGHATFLVMPSWHNDKFIGTKLVTVMPENVRQGLPTISGLYALFDSQSGQPLLLLDAPELTARRTTAMSALASRYLSRENARTLLIVGTGTLAAHMVPAHLAVRDFDTVMIYGRDPSKAKSLAARFEGEGLPVSAVCDLEEAARRADVISCVTTSKDPVIMGEWLKEGCHLDLVGAFRADMREVDSQAVCQASLFADTWDGVLSEGGDIVIPRDQGLINGTAFRAELADLVTGSHAGRTGSKERTLFKSVGTAIADFAAAELAYEMIASS